MTSCKSCGPGQYSPSSGRDSCRSCEVGRFSSESESTSCSQCPAGRYQDSSGQTSCTFCPAGYFQPHDGANECVVASEGHFATEGSTQEKACPPGRYSSSSAATHRECDGPCQAGRYCANEGTTREDAGLRCPAGRYGEAGEDDPDCTGACPAGYVCGEGTGSFGSTNPPEQCGGIEYYCPEGSSTASEVDEGYYTIPEDSTRDTREGEEICPRGSYCQNGERFNCPEHHYGSQEGMTDSSCSGRCADGFYCPHGSSSPREELCSDTDPSKYCVEGERKDCPDGYFTLPEGPDKSTRSDCQKCSDEFACLGGLRQSKTEWVDAICGTSRTFDTIFVDEHADPVEYDTTLRGDPFSVEVRVDWKSVEYKISSFKENGRRMDGGTCSDDLTNTDHSLKVETTESSGEGSAVNGELQLQAQGKLAFRDCDQYSVAIRLDVTEDDETTIYTECEFEMAIEFVNSDPEKKDEFDDGDITVPLEFEAFRGQSFGESVGEEVLSNMFFDPDGRELTFTLVDEDGNPVTDADHPFSIGACSGQM